MFEKFFAKLKNAAAASNPTNPEEIEKNTFTECGCIPRSLREECIDKHVISLVQASGKTSVTLLSLGSGNLGQEYHINKKLAENGIYVQWLLVDKIYSADDNTVDLLNRFKESIEKSGSTVLGAYSDVSAYAAFKLGKSDFSRLRVDIPTLFTKTWGDLFHNHPLNAVIFKRKHSEFLTNPLPNVDFILAIDMNPSGLSGYEKTRELTQNSIDAVKILDPEAGSLSVMNKNSRVAIAEVDLDIKVIERSARPSLNRFF